MDGTLNVNYKHFLDIIKHLPKNQLEIVKLEMQSMGDKTEEEKEKFINLLLSGPVMDDVQYQDYLERRNNYNIWDKG